MTSDVQLIYERSANEAIICDNMASSYESSSEEQTELHRLHNKLMTDIVNNLDQNSEEFRNFFFHFEAYVPKGILANKSLLDKLESLVTRQVITRGVNYEKLKQICRDSGNDSIVSTIETYEKQMEDVRCRYTVPAKKRKVDDLYQDKKKEFKKDLIKFYKWHHSNVNLSPLFNEKDTPLASFYIRPELNVKTTLQEMFNNNREIYLKADAGLGKTTFSKYLAISWHQAHCPDEKDLPYFEKKDIDCMRDFDFVFLVLLRDSNTSCSVDELIFNLIISRLANSNSYTKDFMQELLRREKCLVILDGLDEWTHPVGQCEMGPRSIPHRNCVREKCTILTTTRPWKLGDLNLSSNELGKTVELTKLSRDSAGTLVTRTLLRLKSPPHNMSIEFDDATLVEEIFNSQVSHLAYVPLLLMYIICLRCERFNIGNSKCELYVKIVALLLSRTTQKYGDISQKLDIYPCDIPACFAKHDKCKEYFTVLIDLGQLAYNTLSNKTKQNTLVFDGSITEKYLTKEEMKFTLHSGILSQSTTKTLTETFSKVSFSHKTVQEFFAAIFISSHSDGQNIVLEKCRSVQDILDMSKVWEFISEMNADRMCSISYDLISVINEDEKTRNYRSKTCYETFNVYSPLYNIQEMFMSCSQEMPKSEHIQLCLQDFFISYDAENRGQLQRMFKQNKTNIKSLFINNVDTSIILREIIDLFSITDLTHIQKLVYTCDGFFETKNSEINRLLFPSLQFISFQYVYWTNYEENLTENFAQIQNLQYICIACCTLSHKILELFLNFISVQKSIKKLVFDKLECDEHMQSRDDCQRRNFDLSQHLTLSKLHLWLFPRLQLKISTPSLVKVKLKGIILDENSILLSPDMWKIKLVELFGIKMSARSLYNFIIVLKNLPQSVKVVMRDIKPEAEYEHVREYIRSSQTFIEILNYRVFDDYDADNDYGNIDYDDDDWFAFETRKPSKE